jgi:hypothetical protein
MNAFRWAAFALFLLLSKTGFSCSCVYQPMGMQKMLESDCIFQGMIISKVEVVPTDSSEASELGTYWKYKFEVTFPIKNVPDSNVITIYSSTQESACGVNYAIGDELMIFSHTWSNRHWTGICAANKHVANIDSKYQVCIDSFLNSSGSQQWTNVDGSLDSEGTIIFGEAQGEWIYYHDDGSVKSKGHFNKGVKTGEWKYFLDRSAAKDYLRRHPNYTMDPNSSTIQSRIEIYKEGKVIDRKSIWD